MVVIRTIIESIVIHNTAHVGVDGSMAAHAGRC